MTAGNRRRLEGLERSLARSSVYAPEPFSDAQLIQAMKDGTATLAQMKQVYDICAPDLEIRLFQEAKRLRDFPDFPAPHPSRKDTLRFGWAAQILRYRADEDPGFELHFVDFEPQPWLETPEGRRFPLHGPDPFYFSIWARAALLASLLDHDPLALEFRRRLDEWCDGGDPPVDLLRYPEPREYLLLHPIGPYAYNCLDIEMLRFPHKELYESMDWDGFGCMSWRRFDYMSEDRFDEPNDGLVWTRVDTMGRRGVPSEYD
jgi:hypothetical protein